MEWVWTHGGRCFGCFEGENLWTHDGKHVGKREGDDIYRADGSYLGEVTSGGRLIRRMSKSSWSRSGFTPYASRSGYAAYTDYVGYAMYAGCEDFPAPESF
jgi:hypothetical protein